MQCTDSKYKITVPGETCASASFLCKLPEVYIVLLVLICDGSGRGQEGMILSKGGNLTNEVNLNSTQKSTKNKQTNTKHIFRSIS